MILSEADNSFVIKIRGSSQSEAAPYFYIISVIRLLCANKLSSCHQSFRLLVTKGIPLRPVNVKTPVQNIGYYHR